MIFQFVSCINPSLHDCDCACMVPRVRICPRLLLGKRQRPAFKAIKFRKRQTNHMRQIVVVKMDKKRVKHLNFRIATHELKELWKSHL